VQRGSFINPHYVERGNMETHSDLTTAYTQNSMQDDRWQDCSMLFILIREHEL